MSGIATIMPDNISLLAEIIEMQDEIDVERAKAAKKRAEERLEKRKEDTDIERAEVALRRANVRLEVAEL
jgi:F-type H+-transporting ATPase subunit epsilon